MLNRTDYNHWLAIAARLTRRRDEAEDLLHESLLAAVQARRTDFADERTRAWFMGLMRNKAMMTARSAGRRKRREGFVALTEAAAFDLPAHDTPAPALAQADRGTLDAIRQLPRAARIVAILALHGLTREEIASILDLSDEALRQRLTTLRKRWRSLPQATRERALDDARRRRTLGHALEAGLIRRALVAWLQEIPGVGTHDPDGHLIVLGKDLPSRNDPRRQHESKTKEV